MQWKVTTPSLKISIADILHSIYRKKERVNLVILLSIRDSFIDSKDGLK